jgi:hypothetical protein
MEFRCTPQYAFMTLCLEIETFTLYSNTEKKYLRFNEIKHEIYSWNSLLVDSIQGHLAGRPTDAEQILSVHFA